MGDTNFFPDAQNCIVSGGTFTTAQTTLNNNTYVYLGINENERIAPIIAPRRNNSSPSLAAPIASGSVGDIATAIAIVQAIYGALEDSTGSSSKYMRLIEELRSFEGTLYFIDRLLEMIPLDESIRQAIQIEIIMCLKVLRTFWGRVERYEVVLSARWTTIWRKITWAICKTSEVKRFRQILSHHEQHIRLFLSGLQIAVASSGADAMRQDITFIKQQVAEIRANQQRAPTSVGYGLENVLILINAFGERITLSMEFCWSKRKLNETLIGLFKGKIDENHVKWYDYNILTEDGKSVATSNNWRAVVKPGKVIIMRMIVKKVVLEQKRAKRQRNSCPRCYQTQVGVMRDDAWLQCRRCERRFGWKTEAIYALVPPLEDLTIADFRNIQIVPVISGVREPIG